MIERRQHERFLLEKRAITVLWPASSIVGQIVDISLGGLAFRYSAPELPEDDASEIEIIVASHNYHSAVLPFKTIFDEKVPGLLDSFVGRQPRLRHIQFEKLTDEQEAEIQCFIDDYCWRAPA